MTKRGLALRDGRALVDFSFLREGPLDMRTDPTRGEMARDLFDRLSIDELADLIRRYGEERCAGGVARTVKEAIDAGEGLTTTEMAQRIADVVPSRERSKEPATRTSQALRIPVNDKRVRAPRSCARPSGAEDQRHFIGFGGLAACGLTGVP